MPKEQEQAAAHRAALGPLRGAHAVARGVGAPEHGERPHTGATTLPEPTPIRGGAPALADTVPLTVDRTGVADAERATRAAAKIARAELAAARAASQLALAASQVAERAARDATKAAGAAARVADQAARTAAAALVASARVTEVAAVARARLEANTTALRELARLKDAFLGTVSHELRSPLQLARGYAELLRLQFSGPGPGPTTGRLIGHIVESTCQMAGMMDDLLDFAAAEQGLLKVRPVDLDLTPVLRAAAAGFTYVPGAERLALALPPALPAHADAARVAQVTTNLLANAFKYAPAGPVTLRARTGPGGAVRVTIEDRGPGIPPPERRRVWEKFYRGATSRDGGPPGTGIGLAVVKTLVEAQGGRVGLVSTAGQGSRFWFELPPASHP